MIELSSLLPFLDYSVLKSGDQLQTLEGSFDPELIDLPKLQKKLPDAPKGPVWFESEEINRSFSPTPYQLDLLGNLTEPCLLLQIAEQLFLFKFRAYHDASDIYYGKDQKRLIEALVRLWISEKTTQNQGNPENNIFVQVSKNQLERLTILNDQLRNSETRNQEFYLQLFRYFLREETEKDPKLSISLSKSALEYLAKAEMPFGELEKLAKQSFEIAKALQGNSSDLVIRGYYFVRENEPGSDLKDEIPEPEVKARLSLPNGLSPRNNQKPNPPVPIIPKVSPIGASVSGLYHISMGSNKLEKTIVLLDRYETALQTLVNEEIPILGKNLAATCQPPISAPALTDSINKHKLRIGECLKLYPDHWPLLREHYQPVKSLV